MANTARISTALGFLKISEICQRGWHIWTQGLSLTPQSSVRQRGIEPLYQPLYLAVPYLEDVEIGLLVGIPGHRDTTILRHSHGHFAGIDDDLMLRTKSDFVRGHAAKDMRQDFFKESLLAPINTG